MKILDDAVFLYSKREEYLMMLLYFALGLPRNRMGVH